MLSLDLKQTIAAISVPSVPSRRGIVRLSGPEALDVATQDFSSLDAQEPVHRPSGRFVHGLLDLPRVRAPIPARLALWRAPRTYTGEDLAEIHLLGSPPLVQAVLDRCLELGARPAERGEFTLRAFLNGRIDLAAAEGVLEVVNAKDARRLDAALMQMAGGSTVTIRSAKERLVDVLALMEAGLDFAEEPDVAAVVHESTENIIEKEARTIEGLLEQFGARELSTDDPRVVLVGAPNAGKSSLFNALAADGRAIVTPLAGTTRDALFARIDCAGATVELVDTAGFEVGSDDLAKGMELLRINVLKGAQLIVVCRPQGQSFDFHLELETPTLEIATKSDLGMLAHEAGLLATSSATGEGLARLKAAIAVKLEEAFATEGSHAPISSRTRDCLVEASACLRRALEEMRISGDHVLAAIEIRRALDELGKVFGETTTDDILDRVFRRFCIGK